MVAPELKQNPQIEEFEVGVRTLKTLHVYPLSVGQELKVSDIVSETLTQFFAQKVADIDEKVVRLFLDLFQKNLKQILTYILDLDELRTLNFNSIDDLLNDITNEQLIDLYELVKEANFDRLIKNLKGPLKNLLMSLPTAVPAEVSQPLKGQ